MEELIKTMREAMEQAAISGLCRDGQLEIAVQEGRKVRPKLDNTALLALAELALERGE